MSRSPIHPLAQAGFGSEGERYDEARPGYSPAAIAALELAPAARVLDLAAGTGQLTRALRGAGHPVVAVEPLSAMRERLDAEEVLDGTAEAIPLADACVDAVTVGDAWHWFDGPRAAGEVARVLRPGGVLALLWRHPEPSQHGSEWFAAVAAAIAEIVGDHPGFTADQGRAAVAEHRALGPLEQRTVEELRTTDAAGVLAFVATLSPVAAMSPPERERFLRRVAAPLPAGPLRQRFTVRIHRAIRACSQPTAPESRHTRRAFDGEPRRRRSPS